MNQQEWIEELEDEGFEGVKVCPIPPSKETPEHTHDQHTVHVILKGALIITDDEGATTYRPGDRVEFEAETTHKAKGETDDGLMITGIKEEDEEDEEEEEEEGGEKKQETRSKPELFKDIAMLMGGAVLGAGAMGAILLTSASSLFCETPRTPVAPAVESSRTSAEKPLEIAPAKAGTSILPRAIPANETSSADGTAVPASATEPGVR